MNKQRKLGIVNTALLLGLSAILFRAYLPLVDEIRDINHQLKTQERQIESLKSEWHQEPGRQSSHPRKIFALPEAESEHLSQQLANLASQHHLKLSQIEPAPEKATTLTHWKLKLTPYLMAFSQGDAGQFASLLADLQKDFPELLIEEIDYDKEIGSVKVQLLTSSKGVRLFAP